MTKKQKFITIKLPVERVKWVKTLASWDLKK